MKKSILLIAALTVSFCAQSQTTLFSEDCSGMTVGNVVNGAIGTTYGAATVGQNAWKAFSGAGTATAADFQVVDMGGTYGNALQITGADDDVATNSRRLIHDYAANWQAYYDAHTTDAKILTELEVEYFSGALNGSLNTSRLYIWDKTRTTILAGFYMDKNDFTIKGIINLTTTPAGSLSIISFAGTDANGDPTPEPVLEEMTWYKLGVSIDYNNNNATWRVLKSVDNTVIVNGFYDSSTAATPAATMGKDCGLVEFTAHPGPAGNALSSLVTYDNFVIKSNNTDSLLLSTKQNTLADSKFSVSPNPSSNVIRVTNSENINVTGIAVTDLNGRVVKQQSYNDASNIQVNVSDLATGIYLMKITSDKGVATKKIIKN